MFRVIIIDDEYVTAQNLKDMISWEDYGFHTAKVFSDSTHAMDHLKSFPVDLVLTDIQMPAFSGIDIAKICAGMPTPPVVVFMSAYSEFEYAREALQNRVFDYLVKPFSYSDIVSLLQKVEKILQARSNAKENAAAPSKETLDFPSDLLNCDDEVVVKTLQFIRASYHKNISLDDIARHVALSRSYYCTYFKNITGENFVDVLNRFRIHKATQMLCKNDAKISSVAEAVGYKSVPYFYKIFTVYTGFTPSEYRKHHKGEE